MTATDHVKRAIILHLRPRPIPLNRPPGKRKGKINLRQRPCRGADCVMELVGLPDAQKLAYNLIRPGGTMSVIGCHCTPDFQFGPAAAYDKNLTYRTGRCPARHYMDVLTPKVANGEFDLTGFVTHEFEIDDSVKAYDVFSKRLDNCGKAVIRF